MLRLENNPINKIKSWLNCKRDAKFNGVFWCTEVSVWYGSGLWWSHLVQLLLDNLAFGKLFFFYSMQQTKILLCSKNVPQLKETWMLDNNLICNANLTIISFQWKKRIEHHSTAQHNNCKWSLMCQNNLVLDRIHNTSLLVELNIVIIVQNCFHFGALLQQ